jgi:oligosaccharide repeat unit polymerase
MPSTASNPLYLMSILLAGTGVVVAYFNGIEMLNVAIGVSLFGLSYLLIKYRGDYLHPIVAFVLPWCIILAFSLLDISEFSRPVSSETYLIIISIILASLALGTFPFRTYPRTRPPLSPHEFMPNDSIYKIVVFMYLLISLANIAIAGYIPLLRTLGGDSSGYLDFGSRGFYGFYNAFANALAIVSIYFYFHNPRKRYLVVYMTVIFFFIIFITRQNIITTLVETFVVYSITKYRIKLKKMFFYLIFILVGFSLIGQLRSGDILSLAKIKPEYNSVPAALVWPYVYSYFNVMNFDNLVTNSMGSGRNVDQPPYYNGSSLNKLIPSTFRRIDERPEVYLESAKNGVFAVFSYMFIFEDIGPIGLIIFTIVILFISLTTYSKALSSRSFINVCNYSVLYFCALLSFFVNYWFYLPVIFQLVCFRVLALVLLRPLSSPSYANIAKPAPALVNTQKRDP